MLERLLPRTIGNRYRGHPAALWVFGALTLMTLWRSLVHMFRADGGAQSIATIPLDTYSDAAATAIIVIFSLWGLQQLVVGVIYVGVLARYRALIPAMYLLLLLEYVGRIGVGLMKGPLETVDTPPGAWLNLAMIVTSFAMLFLSLRPRAGEADPASEASAAAG
jgi:hypothetical protein